MEKSKTIYFNATCIATYKCELEVPEDTKQDELLTLIMDELPGIPANDLEWLADTEEPVTIDDIQNIDDFDE